MVCRHSLLKGDFLLTRSVPSFFICVGDLVLLEKNQRVLADLTVLRTSDSSGTCFIRTDQLDGETDSKLRVTVPATQKLPDHELLNIDAEIYGTSKLIAHPSSLFAHTPAVEAPSKDIHTFIGAFTINTPPTVSSNDVPMVQVLTIEPLSAENMLWANTVLAAGSNIGFVEYTGPETHAVMNTSHPDESWAIGSAYTMLLVLTRYAY
jgi:phospholipid-translocating ATPase